MRANDQIVNRHHVFGGKITINFINVVLSGVLQKFIEFRNQSTKTTPLLFCFFKICIFKLLDLFTLYSY